jgi:hypothetical protein
LCGQATSIPFLLMSCGHCTRSSGKSWSPEWFRNGLCWKRVLISSSVRAANANAANAGLIRPSPRSIEIPPIHPRPGRVVENCPAGLSLCSKPASESRTFGSVAGLKLLRCGAIAKRSKLSSLLSFASGTIMVYRKNGAVVSQAAS